MLKEKNNSSEYVRSLEDLQRFNSFILNNPELRAFFADGPYNFLQIYQSLIFFEFLDKNKKEGSRKPIEIPRAKNLSSIRVRQLVAIIFSLVSCVFLILSRRRVLIYTADKDTYSKYTCDFRVANLFENLSEHDTRFIEVMHTVFPDNFSNMILKRRRPTIYLEAIDVFYKLFSRFSSISIRQNFNYQCESEFFKHLIRKYADMTGRFKFRSAFLKNLLRLTGVKTLIATADPRNYMELIEACNLNNIKTYAFQGGNISKYNVGFISCGGGGKIVKPNKMIVESEYWKKELKRLGTYFHDDDLIIGGNLKEDYRQSSTDTRGMRSKGARSDIIKILIPYETAAPKAEVARHIEKLVSMGKDIEVIFKSRADRTAKEQIAEYHLEDFSKKIRFVTNLDGIQFDIVAGTYSTFLYEMIGQLKPVAILKTSLDYGEGLVVNGLAQELDHSAIDLKDMIGKIANTPTEILISRRNKLYSGLEPLSVTLNKILSS